MNRTFAALVDVHGFRPYAMRKCKLVVANALCLTEKMFFTFRTLIWNVCYGLYEFDQYDK